MRSMRNIAFAVLVGVWLLTPNGSVLATDLGCEGEDGVGSTGSYGPYFCQTSQSCCDAVWDNNASDTLEPFCEPYGGPDWGLSNWTADTSTQTTCDGFVINCFCTPPPR